MNTVVRASLAVALKQRGGCNCCQAVLLALADETALSGEDLKPIGAGFCAGMGTTGATCGALLGAGMIASLKTKGENTLKYSRQLFDEFERLSGATLCKDLKETVNGAPRCSCDECVKNAIFAYGKVFNGEE